MKRFTAFALSLLTVAAIAGPFSISGGGSGGGGSGTVSGVSVTPSNGVTGTVTNPTTTPAIALSLGAITPTSVSTGTVTATVMAGTPTYTLTNATGLPISAGVSGLGTGIATALGVNVGSAGAPVVNGGALGTPSSGTATNLTGTAASLTAGAATVLATPRAIAGHNFDGSAAITIACGDLSNGATGCSTATGTSGATIPLLNGANTWSAAQSFNSSDLVLKGATSGTTTVNAAATAGSTTITLPGGTTDFSATGGTSQVVKQTSSGGALTVGRLACADLSDSSSGCSGSAGAGLSANTFTDTQTIAPTNSSQAITFSASTTGTGTVTTNGSVTVTGSGTKFLSQLKGGDSITPAGESARTVQYVNSDTSLVLTAVASGSHTGVAYTIAPVACSIGPNGKNTCAFSSPGAGQSSERFGDGATAAGNNSTVVGANASAAGGSATVSGWGAQAGGSLGTAYGYLSSANAGVALGANTIATDGGNATGIAAGYQASTAGFQSMVFGRNVTASADGQLIFGSTAVAAARLTDVYFGNRVATTPVGITIHSVGGSGSNAAGSDLAIAPGASTGTGASGNLLLQTAPTTQTTGSTANTVVTREAVSAAGTALTSASAIGLVDVALPTLTMAGGTLHVNIISTDGTDMQSLSCVVAWSAVNKGGVYTTSIKTPSGGTADDTTCAKSVSAGTITLAWTIVSGTNKVTFKANVTTSLTPTTLRAYYSVQNHSLQAITPL